MLRHAARTSSAVSRTWNARPVMITRSKRLGGAEALRRGLDPLDPVPVRPGPRHGEHRRRGVHAREHVPARGVRRGQEPRPAAKVQDALGGGTSQLKVEVAVSRPAAPGVVERGQARVLEVQVGHAKLLQVPRRENAGRAEPTPAANLRPTRSVTR